MAVSPVILQEVLEDRTERTGGCLYHTTKFCTGGDDPLREGQVSECI